MPLRVGSGVLLSGGHLPVSWLPEALTMVGLMQVRMSSVDQVRTRESVSKQMCRPPESLGTPGSQP